MKRYLKTTRLTCLFIALIQFFPLQGTAQTWNIQASGESISSSWMANNNNEGWAVGGESGVIWHTTNGGTSWSAQFSGINTNLRGIWGTDASNVWAVGGNGKILKYNGTSWSEQLSNTSAYLSGIWGTDASHIWTVGGEGTILKYDGTSWSQQTSGTNISISRIWGSDASNIWAVGSFGVVLRYNGTSWIAQSTGANSDLIDIWGSDASNIWVVGNFNTILKYNGTSWSAQSVGSTETFLGVWGTDANNVWLVGGAGNILKYNGSSWAPQSSNITNSLYSIRGNDASNIWAVGEGGTILKYDGISWSPQIISTNTALHRVWCSDVSNVWAVGEGGKILKYNGSSWAVQTVGTSAWFYDIWGSDASNVWAVGNYSIFIGYDINGDAIYEQHYTIQKYNGSSWSEQKGGIQNALLGIWGSDASNVWVVGGGLGAGGSEGIIMKYNGSSWQPLSSGTTFTLNGIWGNDPSNIWVTGNIFPNNHTIRKYNGTDWKLQYSSNVPYAGINAIWSSDASNVWAVGDGGAILKYDGTFWSVQSSGTTKNLFGVWGRDASNVWAVGANGTILKYNGTSWSEVTSGTTITNLRSIGGNNTNLWAAGDNGMILSSNYITNPSNCLPPNNITVGSIMPTSATVSWTVSVNAASYKLEYKKANDIEWNIASSNITTNSYQLTFLTASTDYNIRLSTNCISGSTSIDYGDKTFTTAIDNSCAPVTNVSVGSITSTSAVVSWMASINAASYKIEYRKSSQPNWTVGILNTTATNFQLTNLIPNSEYDIQITSKCPDGTEISVLGTGLFVTPIGCNPPTNVKIIDITNNSATVSWLPISNSSSYDVDYKKSSESNWITVSSLDATKILTGLSLNTSYDVRVSSNCGSGAVSTYSTPITFLTKLVTISGFTPNSDCYSGVPDFNGTYWLASSSSYYRFKDDVNYYIIYNTINSRWEMGFSVNGISLINLSLFTNNAPNGEIPCTGWATTNSNCPTNFTFSPCSTTLPNCTTLTRPAPNATNVDAATSISWTAVSIATGYRISIGTTVGGTNIVNNMDVGDVTSYQPLSSLPLNTKIYVSISAYNSFSNAQGCAVQSFTTSSNASPANDNCGTAQVLTIGTGVNGSTAGATDGFNSCTGSTFHDVWYQFTATATRHQVTITSTTPNIVNTVILSGGCASLTCISNQTNTLVQPAVFYLSNLTIGNVYFINLGQDDINYVLDFNIKVAIPPDCTFTGAIDNNWNNAGNWSCGHVPTAYDNTVIYNATVIIDTDAAECGSLKLDGINALIKYPVGLSYILNVNDLDWRGGTIQNDISMNNSATITTATTKRLKEKQLLNIGAINISAGLILDGCDIANNGSIDLLTGGYLSGTNFDINGLLTSGGNEFDNYGELNIRNNGTSLPINFYNKIRGSINIYNQSVLSFPFDAKFFEGSTVTVSNSASSSTPLPKFIFQGTGMWFEGAYTINNVNIDLGNLNRQYSGSITGNSGASLSFNRNMNLITGSIEIPLNIASSGSLTTLGVYESLSAKITNEGTIFDFNKNAGMIIKTGAAIDNQANGEIKNPNFVSNSALDFLILNNYGKITLSNAATYQFQKALLNNYGNIDFKANGAIFLPNNTVFGPYSTFIVGSGLQPALFFNKTLELQGAFNAKSVMVVFNAATSLLSGIGSLTVERMLQWKYGQVDCPIYIEANASAELYNNSSNLKLYSSFYNRGKTTSYLAQINFNNGYFENQNEFQLVNTKFLNESGSNTASNNFYNCGRMILFGGNTTPTSEILVNYTACTASSIGGTSPLALSTTVFVIDTLRPGASPGTLTINPSVSAASTAVFDMEITGGYGAAGIADDADKLVSSGNIEINGTLLLRLTNPQNGNYTIIDGTSLTGSFTSIQFSLNGGAFTTTQPSWLSISYDNVQGTVTVSISAVLPIELVLFSAIYTEGGNLLTWQTSQEANTTHFDVERSENGKTFQKIGETKAQGKAATYEYLDKALLWRVGELYYRLKINDLDMKSSYSNVVSVTTKQKGLTAKVFPNPFGDNLSIEISIEKKSDVTIELIDVLGRQVYQSKVKNTEGVLNLPISTKDLPSGAYFLKIKDGFSTVEHKIVKNGL